MPRVPAFHYRHRNTSLPEDLRVPPAYTTHKMLSPTSESATFATFGSPIEPIPPGYPGRVEHTTDPDDPLMKAGFPDDPSINSNRPSTSSSAQTVVVTEEAMTTTAGAGSPSVVLGSPVAMSAGILPDASLSISTSLSTSSSVVNEDTATVPDPPSPTITSTPSPLPTSVIGPPVIAVSNTVTTSNLASSLSTTQPPSSSYGGPACDNGSRCVAVEGGAESHSGIIAGTVIGVVAGIGLVTAAFMLWRWRRKRTAKTPHPESDSAWHKISRSDGAPSTATATDVGVSEEHNANKPEDRDLGEPGPSFDFGEIETTNTRTPHPHPSLQNHKKLSESTWSKTSLDRFHSATDTSDEDNISRSRIGVALTRYSTAESTAPLSRPFSPRNCPIVPYFPKEDSAEGHKRHSSMSAQSDATIRQEDEVVYVGKARTARRHSFTPRVINIVATGGSSDKIDYGSKNDDDTSTAQKGFNRESMRSRSMSPNKLLSGYSDFINDFSSHLHKNLSDWHPPQNDQINRSSTTKTTATATVKYPIIPERGRSLKRKADQHISYPPTSYPKLGKTMSEVKRTIREKGDSAFANSDDLWDQARTERRRNGGPVAELPSSVTIARGGRPK